MCVGGVRVRVEIMGSQKCEIVGKSQSVLAMMINPMISARTRRIDYGSQVSLRSPIQCVRHLWEWP
eukprot:COSAG01_NODE_4432_length_5031_cov_3.848540_5_plen_66_part_00